VGKFSADLFDGGPDLDREYAVALRRFPLCVGLVIGTAPSMSLLKRAAIILDCCNAHRK
jgi:hypothetical protein